MKLSLFQKQVIVSPNELKLAHAVCCGESGFCADFSHVVLIEQDVNQDCTRGHVDRGQAKMHRGYSDTDPAIWHTNTRPS